MICLKNLSFSYPSFPIFHDVSLNIEAKCVGIFGPNGGGKTTLLKLLMGFLTPQQGSITLWGKSPEKVRSQIGYVPQAHRIDPDLPITLYELVSLGMSPSQVSFWTGKPSCCEQKKHTAAIALWLEELGLTPHQNKTYGELSGGLAQRALLARALVSNPDLLLLDEPTANIDPPSLEIVLGTLARLKKSKTILLVTHDLATAKRVVDEFLCVRGNISSLHPEDICNHFHYGLYQIERELAR